MSTLYPESQSDYSSYQAAMNEEFDRILKNCKDHFSLICSLANADFDDHAFIAANSGRILPHPGKPHSIRCIALYHSSVSQDGVGRVLSILSGVLAGRYKVILITDEGAEPDHFEIPPTVMRASIPSFNDCTGYYERRGSALNHLITSEKIDAFIYATWDSEHLLWDMLCIKACDRHPAFFLHIHNFCAYIWRRHDDIVRNTWKPFSLADGVITMSEADHTYWHFVNPNTYMIPNPAEARIPGSKNSLHEGPHHILWIGRIAEQKQPLEMVRIMKQVVRFLPDTICHMAGDGSADQKAKLKAYIRECALGKNIILEGYREDTESLYRNADIFVSTSDHEAFPMTFMESASYGIPTVAYDLPWLEYFTIIDGWEVTDQYDAAKAAEIIVHLLSDGLEWEDRSNRIFDSFRKFQTCDIGEEWAKVFADYEKGTSPEYSADSEMIGLLLDQTVRFHSREVMQSRKMLEDVYRSASWRIGNTIVQPLHLIRSLLKKINN